MARRNDFHTLYAKLGIKQTASAEDIQRAYHTLAKIYHPDGHTADERVSRAFADISMAAAILRDPAKRRLYDEGRIDETGALTERETQRRHKRFAMRVFVAIGIIFFTAIPLTSWLLHNLKTTNHAKFEVQKRVQSLESRTTKASYSSPSKPGESKLEQKAPLAPETLKLAPVSDPPSQGHQPGEINQRDLSREEQRTVIHNQANETLQQRDLAQTPRHTLMHEDKQNAPPLAYKMNSAACLACLTNSQADCTSICSMR